MPSPLLFGIAWQFLLVCAAHSDNIKFGDKVEMLWVVR